MKTINIVEFSIKLLVIILISISIIKVMKSRFQNFYEREYNKNPKNVVELTFLFIIMFSGYVITQTDMSIIGITIKTIYVGIIFWLLYLLMIDSFIKNLSNKPLSKNNNLTLNKTQKKELFILFQKWFKNSDEEINNLIELNIENLKDSKLICMSTVTDFYLIIIFLIKENIYTKENVKKLINQIEIKTHSGNGEFNFDNFTKYKNKFKKEWDEKENNFKSLNKNRNKNRALIRNFINHYYYPQNLTLLEN